MSLFVRSEDDDVDTSGIPQIESNCISVADFGSYTEEQHGNSNRGFRDQYFVSVECQINTHVCVCVPLRVGGAYMYVFQLARVRGVQGLHVRYPSTKELRCRKSFSFTMEFM